MAQTPEETGGRSQLSGQQAAIVIGGLLVVLVLMWFLFLRGGSETEPTTALPPSPTVTQEPPAEDEEPAEEPDDGPVETFEVFAPKDPFDPLVSEAGGGGAAGGSGVTIGGTETSTGTGTSTGAETGTGTGTGGSTQPGETGNGSSSVGGHRVKLIDTFREGGNERAQVQVDGTVYTVDEGETFAENFKVLSINGDCATMLFGDDQFTLCEGEEILK